MQINDIICVILQLLLFICILLSILFGSIIYIVITCIVYILFIIFQLCSTWVIYLENKNNNLTLKSEITKIFRAVPDITFYAECFHYVNSSTNNKEKECKGKKKYMKYNDYYNLPYFSSRDISGTFVINDNSSFCQSKSFIKLTLKSEINFADEISYADYLKQKEAFWRSTRFRDFFMNFKEIRTISEMKKNEKSILKIDNSEEPIFFNIWWYIGFTIIPLTEIKYWV